MLDNPLHNSQRMTRSDLGTIFLNWLQQRLCNPFIGKEHPSQEAVAFWKSEYLDMQTIEKRLSQMRQAGFAVIDHFTLSEQAWHYYYQPLIARVVEVTASMPSSNAIADIEREIAIYKRYLGEFGYQMFVLRKGA